ncbi:MAG TPA: carbamate kinase [Gemmatimonadales bacterium]|nr:carbamate kinase [Gemmatimonadales bacterium]
MSRPRSPTVVVALGGNALARADEPATIANQFRHTRESLAPIVELAREGWRIALVHGNGPQVGDELIRHELGRAIVEPLPLGVLVAGTAGWIGYMIQQSLQNALARAGIDRPVATVITQTVVDPEDPGLGTPTKPVGHPLDATLLERLRAAGVPVGRDGGGRWRRLAASPVPRGVVEAPLVKRLVEGGVITVAAGGGGPPVYRDPTLGWEGVDAVVDKDRVAAILAVELGADVLVILTDVDAVYRGWGTPAARPVPRLTAAEAAALAAGGELGAGSMRPKVEAAAEFVRAAGGRAVIAKLSEGLAALRGETGTTIVRDA